MAGVSKTTNDGFTLKDDLVENHRPMKVVIIGAGFSGIHTTIRYAISRKASLSSTDQRRLRDFNRITQKLRNIDLTVYEMNEEASGVW